MNILSGSLMNGRNVLKQGDTTEIKFLLETNGNDVPLTGSAKVVFYKEGKITFTKNVTVVDEAVSFSINKVLDVGRHLVEVIVGNKHIFPSDTSAYITIVRSSENLVVDDVNKYGIEELTSKIISDVTNSVKPKVTPRIDSDGTWIIGDVDTGIQSKGDKGDTFTYEDLSPEQINEIKQGALGLDKYVTKEQADFDYQPKGNYLTESQAQSQYQPLGNYLSKGEQIGGRNYIPSFNSEKWTINIEESAKRDSNTLTITDTNNPVSQTIVSVEKNTTYTISAKSEYMRIFVFGYDTDTILVREGTQINGYFSETFNTGNASKILVRIDTYSQLLNHVPRSIWDVKLEKGSIASDWTPAPEDFYSEIENLKQAIRDLGGTI